MDFSTLSPELLTLLQEVDTPTVCNAIEVAQKKRGFANFTRKTMFISDSKAKAVVGFARTAKIAAVHPPTEPPEEIRARRMAYFRAMAEGPRPSIAVVEDVDYPDCIGAWWGGVHTAVHNGLGLSGAVTNGVMRDLDDMQPGFTVIARSIGPSHGFVHVKELGTTVNVLGMQVNQGDLIHADRHGALAVPSDVIPKLFDAINTLISTESIILEPARQPDFDIDKLEAAWALFEQSRT